jgi:hypothetical protein
MIDEGKITDSNALKIGRFVFMVFKTGLLNDKDYERLQGLKLLTNNGLKIVHETYLRDEYDPELKIQTILPSNSYVSVSYPENTSELSEWKILLVRIGAKEKMEIRIDPKEISRYTFVSNFPQYQSYSPG